MNHFDKNSRFKLSVIIVTYESLGVLEECINSIYRFNDIAEELELIIVDNSLTNNVEEYIKKSFPSILFKKNPIGGFGRANNIGLLMSSSDSLIFMNPDIILVEPIFNRILSELSIDSDVGLIGCKLLDRNFKSNMSFYWLDRNEIFSLVTTRILNKLNLYISDKMFISGALFAVRKNIFIDIGCFDENISLYFEESDLYRRFRNFGYSFKFLKDCRVIHLEGTSTAFDEGALLKGLISLEYYCHKYDLDFKTILSRMILNQKLILVKKLITFNKIQPQIKALNLYNDKLKGLNSY